MEHDVTPGYSTTSLRRFRLLPLLSRLRLLSLFHRLRLLPPPSSPPVPSTTDTLLLRETDYCAFSCSCFNTDRGGGGGAKTLEIVTR